MMTVMKIHEMLACDCLVQAVDGMRVQSVDEGWRQMVLAGW